RSGPPSRPRAHGTRLQRSGIDSRAPTTTDATVPSLSVSAWAFADRTNTAFAPSGALHAIRCPASGFGLPRLPVELHTHVSIASRSDALTDSPCASTSRVNNDSSASFDVHWEGPPAPRPEQLSAWTPAPVTRSIPAAIATIAPMLFMAHTSVHARNSATSTLPSLMKASVPSVNDFFRARAVNMIEFLASSVSVEHVITGPASTTRRDTLLPVEWQVHRNVWPSCVTNVCPAASNSSPISSGAAPPAALHSYDSAAARSWQLSALATPAAAAMPASDSIDTVFANLLIGYP